MASDGVENGDDKKIGTRYSQLFFNIINLSLIENYLVTTFNYELEYISILHRVLSIEYR